MAVRVEELPAVIETGFGVKVQLDTETGTKVKVAVTVWAAFMATAQLPVPEQPLLDQPAKLDPVVGVAVSVTLVPLVKLPLHVAPQLMPTGLLVMVPLPLPKGATVSGNVATLLVKPNTSTGAARLILVLSPNW